jgi:hypothetical protein
MTPSYNPRPQLNLDATYRAPFLFPWLGDVNGDGLADLLVLGQQYPAPGINGSNWQTQPGRLFLADGQGGFAPAPAALFPVDGLRTVHVREVLFADFNGDGRNDVFIAEHGWDAEPFPGQPNLLFLSTPQGGWRDASATLPRVNDYTHSAAVGDIDGDGDLDLFAGNGYNNSDAAATAAYLLINDGRGNFTRNDDRVPKGEGEPLSTYMPGGGINQFPGSTLNDLDGDGRPDLVVTADASASYSAFRQTTVFWNQGGRFEAAHATRLPEVAGLPAHINLDAAFADFDGDGRKDIVLVGTNGEPRYDGSFVQVFRGLGNRQFEEVSATALPAAARNLAQSGVTTGNPWPQWVRTGDFNGDGAADFRIEYVGPTKDTTPVLWLNDGQGRFSVVTAQAFRPASDHWQFDGGLMTQTAQGLQVVTLQMFEGSGGLLLTGRTTTTPWFGRPNDPGAETVSGGAGNDRLVGGAGNDTINGGAGLDSAAFQLPRAQYTVAYAGQGAYTVAAGSGNEGTDTLRQVEVLRFADGLMQLTPTGPAGDALKLHQALLGRLPSSTEFGAAATQAREAGSSALAASLAQGFAGQTNAQVSSKVLQHFGIAPGTLGGSDPAASYAALDGALQIFFDAFPGTPALGQIVLNMVGLLGNLEADATWGPAARAFNDKAARDFLSGGFATHPVTLTGVQQGVDMMLGGGGGS